MRVVKRKPLLDFAAKYPNAKAPLEAWYHEVKAANWRHTADVKAKFGSADVVANNRVVFDIGGNKYRLIAKIAYRVGVVYIKFIGTHKEYDRIDAATVDQNETQNNQD